MSTIKALALKSALQKARKVGRVEEPVEIDGCSFVMSSLTSGDYEAIAAECSELDDVAYYHAYQIGHICRAIVEIDGADLREVDFIEDEVPDPKSGDGATSTRKIERHEWIRKNVITTWGREAILVAWRKFAELLVEAEKKALSGIVFTIPDEPSEDKLRRILKEVQELEEELPAELATKILSDSGFMRKSTQIEIEAAATRVNEIAKTESAPAPVESTESKAQRLMQERVPLNKQAVVVPQPTVSEQPTVSAQRRVEVPASIRAAAQAHAQEVVEASPAMRRAAELAALESQVDAGIAREIEEVRAQTGLDPRALASITEQPPPAGINRKFKAPAKV